MKEKNVNIIPQYQTISPRLSKSYREKLKEFAFNEKRSMTNTARIIIETKLENEFPELKPVYK